MDVATVTATVAVTVSVIGGLTAGYAALRQRKTEDIALVVQAMRDHMSTLTAENSDLRNRVFTAEQHVVTLTAAVTRCESDKAAMAVQLDDTTRKLDDLKRQVNGN